MRPLRLFAVATVGLWLATAAGVGSDDLPPDATTLVEEYEKDVAAIQKKADEDIKARGAKAVAALTALQDTYTKAGKLDEAVAVRDRVRALKENPTGKKRTEVKWGNSWFPAEVLKRDGDRSFIRYLDWSEGFNEWVTKDRVRTVYDTPPATTRPGGLGRPGFGPPAGGPAGPPKQ